MKKLITNFKSGITIGAGILFTLVIGGLIYASLSSNNWHDPTEVSPGQPLTAQAWNNILEDLNYLKQQIDNIPQTPDIVVDSSGKYWKSFGDVKMTFDQAFGSTINVGANNPKTGCPSLGKSWRLPTLSELRTLYEDKIEGEDLSVLDLKADDRYWTNDFAEHNGHRDALVLKMGNGARYYPNMASSYYVVCIHN